MTLLICKLNVTMWKYVRNLRMYMSPNGDWKVGLVTWAKFLVVAACIPDIQEW